MKINTIYQNDVIDFLNKLDCNSIDLAIADPPYNMKKGPWDNFKTEAEYFSFMKSWVDCLLPKLKSTASLYVFNNAYNSAMLLNYLATKDLVFKNWITWYKKDAFGATKRRYINYQETILFYTKTNNYTFNCDEIRTPYLSTDRIAHAAEKGILKNGKRWFPNKNGRLCGDVWEITSQRHKAKVGGRVIKQAHPTIKPYEMIERMVKASSNEGDLVLDLFSGSGTTSIVAKNLNRNFVGCEFCEDYIAYIESEGITVGRL